jgi:preprotein translocase subunit Sss1
MLEAIGAVIVAAALILFGLGLMYQIGFSIYLVHEAIFLFW